MDSLQFAQPYWLLGGLICCIATLLLLRLLERQRQATLAKFASVQLLGRLTRHVSTRRRRFKQVLLLLAIFLLFAALARPQYGFTWIEVKRKGIDILFALDTSKSMLAEDTRPNRLQRAKLGIMDFVDRLQGDRVGLMPFAGSGYLMCPLTLDYDAFSQSLTSVDTEIIPLGGTNISAAITEAEQVLQNDANHKILVLITDGENLEGNAVEAAKRAKEKGMTIYTVGVGTPGGELIPRSGRGAAGFIKDDSGTYVTSKLDEKTLIDIAEATGGLYVPLGDGGEGLESIYRQKLQLVPREELAERRRKVPIERFGWPLSAAIVLLFLEYLVQERKSGRRLSLSAIASAGRRLGKTAAAVLLALSLISVHRPALASPAEDAYNSGDYLKASELYSQALKKHPDDPKLHYNLGTAAYKNNLHDEAIAAFTEALKSDDLALQQKAYYNRGNALFQKGAESRQADPQATSEKWQEALESFDSALKLDPDDTLARENRAVVARELEQLKQQLQQKNPSQDNRRQEENNQDQAQEKQQAQKQQQGDQQKPQKGEQEKKESGQKQEQSSAETPQPDNSAEQNQPEPEKQDSSAANESREQKKAGAGSGDIHPEPANGSKEEPASGSAVDQNAEKLRDQQRRELGKMTREEALNLLNALKNEEGKLNFVPEGQEPSVRRDW